MKKELVIFLDVGIVGTFVGFESHKSEDDYVYLTYVPLDTFPAKKVTYEKPIPRNSIHIVDPILNIKGVVDRMRIIYTGEEGSIIKDVLESDYKDQVEQLRDKVKSLEMKNAALNQEVEDARAGAKKSIASQKSLTGSRDRFSSPFSTAPFGRSDYDDDGGDFD